MSSLARIGSEEPLASEPGSGGKTKFPRGALLKRQEIETPSQFGVELN